MKPRKSLKRAKPSGRRYKTVDAMVREMSPEIQRLYFGLQGKPVPRSLIRAKRARA